MTSQGQTVLDEEAYTAAMEAVIQKHFFPDLAKMKAQVALMEAMDGGTPDQVQEANDLMEQAEMLAAGTIEVGGKVIDASRMGLDEFLSRYTNEDNVSFTELFKKHQAEHRKRHKWLFDRDACFKDQLLKMGGEQAVLDYEREEETKRVALAERKALMPPPPPKSKAEMLQLQEALRRPKEINHSGTQLKADPHGSMKSLTNEANRSTTALFTSLSNDLEILAQRKMMNDQGVYNLDDFRRTPRNAAAPSPKVNGYGFVSTPQFSPGGGQEEMSPLMTWGTISTPLTLAVDPAEFIQGPKFNIAERPKREERAKRLADQAAKRMASEKAAKRPAGLVTPLRSPALTPTPRSRATPSPSPSTSSTRVLTPAAQELARRLGKVRPSSELFSASKRPKTGASTPASTPSATPTHRRPSSVASTAPSASPMARRSAGSSHGLSSVPPSDRGSSITDDLLKI
mmetsp:Transcript_58650/g.104660  ORF Transcript_58650/g.104660 Transcript_58650/m.104660 type:complete len:457 (-) Transcript_58650:574-1944(-)